MVSVSNFKHTMGTVAIKAQAQQLHNEQMSRFAMMARLGFKPRPLTRREKIAERVMDLRERLGRWIAGSRDFE